MFISDKDKGMMFLQNICCIIFIPNSLNITDVLLSSLKRYIWDHEDVKTRKIKLQYCWWRSICWTWQMGQQLRYFYLIQRPKTPACTTLAHISQHISHFTFSSFPVLLRAPSHCVIFVAGYFGAWVKHARLSWTLCSNDEPVTHTIPAQPLLGVNCEKCF